MGRVGEPSKASWMKAIVLTILLSFFIQLCMMLYSTLLENRSTPYDIPWTFASIWVLLAASAVLFAVYLLNYSVKAFICGGFTAFFLWAIIIIALKVCLPWSFQIIQPNYFGVESKSTIEIEGEFTRVNIGLLYARGDPELLSDFNRSLKDTPLVTVRGFLTWQAGMAHGFMPDPLSVPEYHGIKTLADRLSLILTVGPILLAELFANALIHFFVMLMVFQVIWFAIRREHVWWDKIA